MKVNNHDAELTSVVPVLPNGTQVAFLIDDGLRTSVGRQLSDIKGFINSLPQGTEILVGYMQNGRVIPQQPFTTDPQGRRRKSQNSPGIGGRQRQPVLLFV